MVSLKFFSYSIIILIISVLIGVYVNNTNNTNNNLIDGKDLLNWHESGKYFIYKNTYKIFYILKKIAGDVNSLEKVSYKDSACIVNVFLHGFPTSSYDYKKIWNQYLSKNENVKVKETCEYLLTFDHIGFGFSDKPSNYNYSIFDHADLVEKILVNLNVNNINLIAHDMSDTVTQEIIRRFNLAQTHKYFFNIQKCVLLNGGIFYDILEITVGQKILMNDYLGYFISNYFHTYYGFIFTFKQIFGKLNEPTSRDLTDFYQAIRYNNGNKILWQTVRYLNERAEFNEVWINALNETNVPVTFIFGPADPINPKNKFTEKILEDLPLVKFVKLSNLVGHYPQWEDPFTVYSIMKNFLDDDEIPKDIVNNF